MVGTDDRSSSADDPSNLSSACAPEVSARIPIVCKGPKVDAAYNAYSAICAANAPIPSGELEKSLAALTAADDVHIALASVTTGPTASVIAAPTALLSAVFTVTPSTPVSTGGYTTIAGTPTYAPVGPAVFNTQQAPSISPTAYTYLPPGPNNARNSNNRHLPASSPVAGYIPGSAYVSMSGRNLGYSIWWPITLVMVLSSFF